MMQISPEIQLFIREHSSDDVRVLALQAKKYPDIDMPTVITQIAGRKVAAEKIPSWWEIEKIWYPKHLSLEQCSSEITARYKARLLQGDSLTDLTGGFGIDCSFLATGFKSATYVERQEELCEIAAHNFPVLNLNHINIKNEDGVTYLQAMSPVDCLFLDPARRNEHGGKTVAISDCEPNVAELEELLLQKANRVMIKLSPMLDLSLALKELKQTQEGSHSVRQQRMQGTTNSTRTNITGRNLHSLCKPFHKRNSKRTTLCIHPRTGTMQRMHIYGFFRNLSLRTECLPSESRCFPKHCSSLSCPQTASQ